MNYFISESQIKRLFEDSNSEFEPYVIKLFKFLNEEKKKHKTRKALLDVIKNLTPYMNIPEGYEIYLLELYMLNYRKDGDYSSLTKKNFVDPRDMKGKTISNTLADKYTVAQLPFKGSNLEAYWSKDGKGVPYYIVKSYGWYPIYIFKEGEWYQITDSYSSSTGRQLRNSNPISSWNKDLYEKVLLVTQNEMKLLMSGAKREDILKNKLSQIKKNEKNLISSRLQNISLGYWDGDIQPIKIKYKIKSIDVDDDKATINVDIEDVLKTKNHRQVPTPENYLKGELRGITPEFVEDKLSSRLKGKFREYIGPRFSYHSKLPENSKIKFVFNHLRK